MKDDVIIVLTHGSDTYDVSDMLVPGSLHIQEQACNANYDSTLDSASWSIRFDEQIFLLLRDASAMLKVVITDRNTYDVLFKGQLEPTPTTDWTIPEDTSDITLDAVDFTVALDDPLPQSVAFPEHVGDAPFYIYKKGSESASILYWLLYLAGLSDAISGDAPDIEATVVHFSAKEGEGTIRDKIDELLHDYGYVLHRTEGDKITWSPTSFSELDGEDSIEEADLLASGNHRVSVRRKFNIHDGVKVSWKKTKVMEDALLWRGSLPVGGSEDPFPGEAIAGSDYWPEDSDIIETWMDFGDEYLDTPYLEGSERLRNEDLSLIASSDHYIKDSKDSSIALDPINETNTIVYEALRARLRYKNTGVDAAKLYWTKILGKALVQVASPSVSCPMATKNPKGYTTRHVYTANDANIVAKREWMRLSKGAFELEFDSLRDLVAGRCYRFIQGENRWDGYVYILGRSRVYDQGGAWHYTAVSIAPVDELEIWGSMSIGNTASRDPSSTTQNINVKNALLKPGTTDEREDFELKATTGQVDQDGSWDVAPEFYIKTGDDYLIAIDNNFLDVADGNIKKRALVNGNGDFAITNKRIYLRNVNADGLNARRCNIHGNVETEILINPALVAQPSSRAITNLQTLQVQDKRLAYDLCVWAQGNGVTFNVLHRCEVSEEPDVGWIMFAPITALGTWGSSEIECMVYFYDDDGSSRYSVWSKCTLVAYEVQNEWIFGWPWFGTHTEYEWRTYGAVSGDVECNYGEPNSRGTGFVVAPVQSIDPSSINIEIPGYGTDLRYNEDVTVGGVPCDGFSSVGGQNMVFRCYFGSDYDVLMKKLPSNEQATVDALPIGALYRGAGNALLVKWS